MIPLVLVLIPFVFLDDNNGHTLFGLPGIVFAGLDAVVVIAVFAFVLVDWRCPAGNRFLRGEMNVPKCPGCGSALV